MQEQILEDMMLEEQSIREMELSPENWLSEINSLNIEETW